MATARYNILGWKNCTNFLLSLKMAEIGFKTIGAEKHAELTTRANKIYAENKERLEEFDDETMKSFSESYKDNPLNKLDDEFYDLGDKESVSELRIKYIREHKTEFTTEQKHSG